MSDGVDFRPFGVDSRARPYRYAFLVNPDECPGKLLDALFSFNYGTWGGRFNPLIPVKDGEISEAFWSLLKYVDPDIVYTYVSLTNSQLDRIDREIVPFRIQRHPVERFHAGPIYPPSLRLDPVRSTGILPHLMSPAASPMYFTPPKLLTFFNDPTKQLNQSLVTLLSRNFGYINENLLPGLSDDWERLTVRNDWSSETLFTQIASIPNIVFPFQASEAHSQFAEPTEPIRDEFCIVIGDSADTWLYFWNRAFLLATYLRSKWNTLCLPSGLLADDSFIEPLREFLRRRTSHLGGSHRGSLSFQSFDLSEEQLTTIIKRFAEGIDLRRIVKRLEPHKYPVLTRPTGPYRGWGLDSTTHQQATSRNSLLSPPRSPLPLDRGTWVLDLRIEYVPRFSFATNEVLSWKLPRRLRMAEAFFPGPDSRIDAEYSVSVGMDHYGPLKLRIPDENEIFYRAAGLIDRRTYDEHMTEKQQKPAFTKMALSDKALYLNGILELYEGLQSAGSMFNHSYWRAVWERLSRRGTDTETRLLERVQKTLTKRRETIQSQLAGRHEKAIEWLSKLVINLSREQRGHEQDTSFAELEETFHEQRERAIAETPQLRRATTAEDIGHDRKAASDQLLGIVQWLTDRGIFLQGVNVRCTNCGSRFWRDIGALQQKVKCDGCNYTVAVPVESQWRYRLNSLVRNGIALHGCIAVTTTLLDLRYKARDSFIYMHGVALYRRHQDELPEAEIDILCIADGKLVCGEVKTSAVEFTPDELAKVARIADEISADRVAIGAFNDPQNRMPRLAEQLAALLPLGCEVTICTPGGRTFAPQAYAY